MTSDKLLIESTKSGDYEILKKGAERADGINDVEEFKITEVSVLLQKGKQRLKFTRNLGNPSLHHRCVVTLVSNVHEVLPISLFWARNGPKLLEMQLNFSSTLLANQQWLFNRLIMACTQILVDTGEDPE